MNMKKIFAVVTALCSIVASIPLSNSSIKSSAETYAGGSYYGLEGTSVMSTGNRILVDLNANDNRKASYSRNAYNWAVPSDNTASVKFKGITFKLSNNGTVGSSLRSVNYKVMQKTSGEYSPLTMDGVTINDTTSCGIIKL